uniref:Uncharacterized protein n=1 Tax=Romanomermis culicivorax TaxID=13658 RepID=A0A915HNW4_ROMCU
MREVDNPMGKQFACYISLAKTNGQRYVINMTGLIDKEWTLTPGLWYPMMEDVYPCNYPMGYHGEVHSVILKLQTLALFPVSQPLTQMSAT